MSQLAAQAQAHSISCFFNALFREFHNFSVLDNTIHVPLKNESSLEIPLRKFSLLGRHQYENVFFLNDGEIKTQIPFLSALELITNILVASLPDGNQKKETFLSRVHNSVENMHLALEHRKTDILKAYQQSLDFIQAEQSLMVGHNFHPYPKMRDGFNDEDYAKYSPEMAGQFELHWFFVKPEILHWQSAHHFQNKNILTDFYLNEFSNPEKARAAIPAGYIPFPVHPWQRQHLLKLPFVQQYQERKLLIDFQKSDKKWQPTSSLRSVYASHSEYMLKFSLTLRLTNSIRHLTPVEVVRGLQVYDVFATEKAQQLLQAEPQFKVIFEPAYVALKDQNGNVATESIAVFRDNPFSEKSEIEPVVLATLAQDAPFGGENLIQKHIRAYADAKGLPLKESSRLWFSHYLKVAVQPLMVAQSEFGILLGAHQQNLILGIKDNLPVLSYFRDCQGTGYNELGYSFYHKQVPTMTRDNGNVLEEKGNILFAYYLIVNSTFNVIASISQDNWISEADLIRELQLFLQGLRENSPADISCLNYLLDREQIYQKGNFYCSLQNLNENTTENPLAIYNLISNPLFLKKEAQ